MKHSGTIREQQACNTVEKYAQQMKDAIDKTIDTNLEHGIVMCIKSSDGIPVVDDYSEAGKKTFTGDPYEDMYSTDVTYVSKSLPTRKGGEHNIQLHKDVCSIGWKPNTFHTHPSTLIGDFSSTDYAAALNTGEDVMCLGTPDDGGHIKCIFFDHKNKNYDMIGNNIVGQYRKRNIADAEEKLWDKMNDGEDATREFEIIDEYDGYVREIVMDAIEDGIISQCSVRSNMGVTASTLSGRIRKLTKTFK